MAGAQESRVRTGLAGTQTGRINGAAIEWSRCAELLANVRVALSKSGSASEALGGNTGPALGKAFAKAADRVHEKSRDLNKGSAALVNASNVITDADEAITNMDETHNASHPGEFTPRQTWQLKTEEDVQEEKDRTSAHNARAEAYQADVEARERISRRWADRMDEAFEESTVVMKEIHGIPDPEPTGPGGPGGPGGPDGPGGPRDTTPGIPQGPRDHPRPDDPHDDGPRPDGPRDDNPRPDDPRPDQPGPDQPGPDDSQGDDNGGTPEIYTDHGTNSGGVSTGTLGGLAAGAGAGALALRGLRGGLLPSALNSTGARPIGSTGRVGPSGALGRGAIAPGSPVTRGGAAAGRGAGAGGIGTRGGRGGAGGAGTGRGARAGAGGIGTGRGRGKKDEEEKQASRDLFDDGEDWIDDEGAAPDVLD